MTSARDDYPNLASMAAGHWEYPWIREQLTEALDEIDNLRAERGREIDALEAELRKLRDLDYRKDPS
jgi:hypothetical protein